MGEEIQLNEIVKPLINWYKENARPLPWREGKNPYHIWLSEIMLQQTRIEAVKKYYFRFIEELPTIKDLANVNEERLLKLWEGLGYYNRAKNLKKAAQSIMEQYNGKMPQTYEELLKLQGIGEYTAGAIASIAYNEKVPAVDGNVLRVISRVIGSKKDVLLATTKKEITNRLIKIMPTEAEDFNQALMELGEIVCVPNGKPLCSECPLKNLCIAQLNNLTSEIPVREKKINRRKELKTVFIFCFKDEIAIRKRENTGLLSSMYEFPNIDTHIKKEEVKQEIKQWNLQLENIQKIKGHKHIFSHIEWDMIGYKIEIKKKNDKFQWVKKEDLIIKYPIPTAFLPFQKQI